MINPDNLSRLYGSSLYDLAREEHLTESILSELELVQQIFREHPDYLRLLSEPSIPKAERLSLLDHAFRGRVQEYLLNFLKILCEKGLLREFPGCCREFKARFQKEHHITEAVVTSAVPLKKAEAEALKKKLEDISRNTVILTQKTDSRVIGGLRIELDGVLLDGTVQSRLTELHRRLSDLVI